MGQEGARKMVMPQRVFRIRSALYLHGTAVAAPGIEPRNPLLRASRPMAGATTQEARCLIALPV